MQRAEIQLNRIYGTFVYMGIYIKTTFRICPTIMAINELRNIHAMIINKCFTHKKLQEKQRERKKEMKNDV